MTGHCHVRWAFKGFRSPCLSGSPQETGGTFKLGTWAGSKGNTRIVWCAGGRSSQTPSTQGLRGEGGTIYRETESSVQGATWEDLWPGGTLQGGDLFFLLLSCGCPPACGNLSTGQSQPGARGQGSLLLSGSTSWSKEQSGKQRKEWNVGF